MRNLVAFPLLGLAVILQSSVISQIKLLSGYADFSVVFIAQALQRRVWQAPLLAMFSVTFTGTLFINILSFAVLRILGTPFSFADVIGLIVLPSLLLNMLFSILIYAFMRELSRWVYPLEEYE